MAAVQSGESPTQVAAALGVNLALFFLPPYSPELNPDEFVWNDLKNHGTGRKLITSLAQLRQTVVSHMRQLQRIRIRYAVSFTHQLRDMRGHNGIYFGKVNMMPRPPLGSRHASSQTLVGRMNSRGVPAPVSSRMINPRLYPATWIR